MCVFTVEIRPSFPPSHPLFAGNLAGGIAPGNVYFASGIGPAWCALNTPMPRLAFKKNLKIFKQKKFKNCLYFFCGAQSGTTPLRRATFVVRKKKKRSIFYLSQGPEKKAPFFLFRPPLRRTSLLWGKKKPKGAPYVLALTRKPGAPLSAFLPPLHRATFGVLSWRTQLILLYPKKKISV